jgi:hypothetical protein
VFLAAWFTVLRPKGEATVPPPTTTTTAPPAATPQTGLGRAVDAARKVAGKAAATTAQPAATAAAGTTATKATTSTPNVKVEPAAISAVPAEALAKLPTDVAGALKARKVLVLAVLSKDAKPWRPVADDDRYVNNALKKTNRYKGDVVVKRVAFDNLSTYGPLVNDLDVSQSPSVVIIDRDLKGTVLTGYVDTVSINQAIVDARQNSIHPNVSNDYLRDINSLCTNWETKARTWSHPTVDGKKPPEYVDEALATAPAEASASPRTGFPGDTGASLGTSVGTCGRCVMWVSLHLAGWNANPHVRHAEKPPLRN